MYSARLRSLASQVEVHDRDARSAWNGSASWLRGSVRRSIEAQCVEPLSASHREAARLLGQLADAAAGAERELWE